MASDGNSLCQIMGGRSRKIYCDEGKMYMEVYNVPRCSGVPMKIYDVKKTLPPNTCGEDFLKNYGDKLEQQVAKDFQALEFHPQTPRKIAGLLTAVQALGRPLKVGETRAGLLARCRNALTGKDLWKLMPPHVQQMVTQNEKASLGIGGCAGKINIYIYTHTHMSLLGVARLA